MARRSIRIGLVFSHALAFYRDILRGITTFAIERPDWVLTPIATERRALALAQSLRCDGYVAHLFHANLARSVLALGKPVVNVSGVLADLPCSRVVADHAEVGRLAARHLLERGVRQFGYVGYARYEFSLERERGFRDVLTAAGVPVSVFRDRGGQVRDLTGLWNWNESLVEWLAKLPRPAGILASHDTQAAQICEYCRHLGLRVPDDLAIVGVDDDDLLCQLARPSLSSVALPGERIGYEAAALLEQHLRRTRRALQTVVLPPRGLVVRQSSDLNAVPDPQVAAAVRFIHEHAHEPIHVADVLANVPVARRGLERRFRRFLQRSLSEEIRRAHVARACELLAGTDLPLSVVAERSGCRDSQHLSHLFRAALHLTPSAYRRRHRLRPGDPGDRQ